MGDSDGGWKPMFDEAWRRNSARGGSVSFRLFSQCTPISSSNPRLLIRCNSIRLLPSRYALRLVVSEALSAAKRFAPDVPANHHASSRAVYCAIFVILSRPSSVRATAIQESNFVTLAFVANPSRIENKGNGLSTDCFLSGNSIRVWSRFRLISSCTSPRKWTEFSCTVSVTVTLSPSTGETERGSRTLLLGFVDSASFSVSLSWSRSVGWIPIGISVSFLSSPIPNVSESWNEIDSKGGLASLPALLLVRVVVAADLSSSSSTSEISVESAGDCRRGWWLSRTAWVDNDCAGLLISIWYWVTRFPSTWEDGALPKRDLLSGVTKLCGE